MPWYIWHIAGYLTLHCKWIALDIPWYLTEILLTGCVIKSQRLSSVFCYTCCCTALKQCSTQRRSVQFVYFPDSEATNFKKPRAVEASYQTMDSSNTMAISTQWGRDKMVAILQIILSNAFPCTKILYFKQNFIEIFPLWFKWWYASIGFDKSLAPMTRKAINLIQWRPMSPTYIFIAQLQWGQVLSNHVLPIGLHVSIIAQSNRLCW